jgi:aminoglycoside phosphotransferase (APT) family kinase protein/SAM-dependent methyltransferase
VLAPSFALNGSPKSFDSERLRQLLADASTLGWDEARRRFTSEVLSGRLRSPKRSRLAKLRAKLNGTTWEDTLQDLVDPTRAGWKFLLDLRPDARVLFLGPTWGAGPRALAESCGQVVVLDGAIERLELVRQQTLGCGLRNLTFARVVDPLRLPLGDHSIDLVIVPGFAQWFEAVAGERHMPAAAGDELLREFKRVLAPGGQAFLAADTNVALLLGTRRPRGTTYSSRGLREASTAAGFTGCQLFAPLPFRHKFHQVLDLDRNDRMNFSADAYRTRGKFLRPLVKAWDFWNRAGAVERKLYPLLPGVSAVLSTEGEHESFAERVVHHVTQQNGSGPALSRYYVRPKGVAVLVARGRDTDGAGLVVRLPMNEGSEATCALHHRALTTLANDERIPPALRALFPRPLGEGQFEGQPFFAETSLTGESGRMYYSRSGRRYDRAIVNAAEVVCGLRRATDVPTLIDGAQYDRLCGTWLGELRGIVPESARETIDRISAFLDRTLRGAILPLGWHHGDYDFANLLYGPDDSVRGILDFEVFDAHGLPLIDLLLLLARRPIRKQGVAFGTLFVRSILGRELPPLEAGLLKRELAATGIDDEMYRAIAFCCWLNHLRLRRDSWLVRSSSWLDENLHAVVEHVRTTL